MKSFESIMAGHSDEELLRIIYLQHLDFQPEALEAAKQELASRNISVDKQKEILEGIKKTPQKRNSGIDIQRWRDFTELFDRNADLPFKKQHSFLLLITLGVFIFFIWDQQYMILSTFKSVITSTITDPLYYLIAFEKIIFFLLIFIGLAGLYFKKKSGWIMVMLAMVYFSLSLLESVFISLWYTESDVHQYSDMINNTFFLRFVVAPHIEAGWYHFVFRLILCLLVIYLLTYPNIKKAFQVNRTIFNSTIILSIVLFLLALIVLQPVAQIHFM